MRIEPSTANPPTDPPRPRIGFDRKLSLTSLILALLLCWPVLVFGRPAYYEDTVSYYKGGKTALSVISGTAGTPPAIVGGPAAGAAMAAVAQTKGARSISYSVLTALLAGPGAALVPLVILQALLLAFCASVLLRASGADRSRYGLAGAAFLVSPAAWFASFASPDVFAGILVLVIAILGAYGARLTGPVTLALGSIGAFAITAHSSHVVLALGMLVLALLASGRMRSSMFASRRMFWLTVGPAGFGLAVIVIGGVIGFGEVSLAPKRYPLTLARSLDGAARPYLHDTCQVRRYMICQLYGDRLPSGGEFLWGADGIARRATPAQMDRLRSEEWEIVTRAALRYPWLEAAQAAQSTLRQLLAFRLSTIRYDQRLSTTDGASLLPDPRTPSALTAVLDILTYGSTILALAWLGAVFRRLLPEQRRLVAFVITGVVLNAAICAYFSAVADRYQARVIWVVPLLAAVLWHQRSRSNPAFEYGSVPESDPKRSC